MFAIAIFSRLGSMARRSPPCLVSMLLNRRRWNVLPGTSMVARVGATASTMPIAVCLPMCVNLVSAWFIMLFPGNREELQGGLWEGCYLDFGQCSNQLSGRLSAKNPCKRYLPLLKCFDIRSNGFINHAACAVRTGTVRDVPAHPATGRAL